MSDSNKLVLTAVIGILVGLVLGRLLWYTNVPVAENEEQAIEESAGTEDSISKEEVPVVSEKEVLPATETPVVKENKEVPVPVAATGVSSITVGTQPAGKQVKAEVTASATVWVVVRDNNAGVMGKILGAKHVDAGTTTAIIPLQRATEAKNIYFVVLQDYNGGELDYSLKTVLKDTAGKNIATVFATE